jgi:hypothetical protein
MTRPHPAPPLPQPPQPAQAAKALADAAQAAAGSWTQPLDPDRHRRAVSQLYSTVRDLGIAARGLAAWQPAGSSPGAAPAEFGRLVTSAAELLLLSAWSRFTDVLDFERAGELPDPDEPGTALCHAARDAILSWRRPSGSSHDRDATLRRLIAAIGCLSAAMASLAACAPRHRAISLQAAGADLAAAITSLTAAIGEDSCDPAPGAERRAVQRHRGDPE